MEHQDGSGECPSPTLSQDRRYLSVVLDVPPAVDAAVREWRGRHGPAAMSPPHITVFMTEHADQQEDAPGARVPALLRACEQFSPARVELVGTGTFRPQSPVSFLQVRKGADWLDQVHRACARITPDASPFPYCPHLTLAQNLPEEVLEDAERHFRDFRAGFEARHLSIFCGNLSGWDLLGRVVLHGPEL